MARSAIKKNEINRALKALTKGLQSPANMLAVGNTARAVIMNRTVVERVTCDRQPFKPYSTKPYYAPVESREPGYPKPKGGRRKATRGGRKLKTAVYGGGYGEYKASMGFGGAPQLSVSNRMLSSIQTRVQGARRVILFFGDRLSAAKAHGHHTGGGNVPERRFFGLHPSEMVNLYETLRRQILKIQGMRP